MTKYFLSFSWKNCTGSGYGNTTGLTDKPLSYDVVSDWTKQIETRYAYDSVVILNIIKFG